MAEHSAVNRNVVSSNLTRGALINRTYSLKGKPAAHNRLIFVRVEVRPPITTIKK